MLSRLTRLWQARPATLAAAAAAVAILAALAIPTLRTLTINSWARPASASHARGPWIFGRRNARFTVIEYADLECPYCRMYFPTLRRWIQNHPEVNWEWRNLPLSMHDPAARREATWAECAGEVGGNGAFWRAVAWVYAHSRGGGAGLPANIGIPSTSAAIGACLNSTRPAEVVRAQMVEAVREHILGTPTLRLLDHKTGRSLTLQGPVEGDALLSAIDLLASPYGHNASGDPPR